MNQAVFSVTRYLDSILSPKKTYTDGPLEVFFVDLLRENVIIIIAFSFLPLLFSSFSPPSAKKQGFLNIIRI